MEILFKLSSKFLVITLYIEAQETRYKNPDMLFLKATLAMQSTPQTNNNLTKTSPFCISFSRGSYASYSETKTNYSNTVMKASMQGTIKY